MASYSNPVLRDRLAAEYVLGTLRGRARARFESLMRYDAELRAQVAGWEARLSPLASAASEITPPPRTWQAVSRRLGLTPRRPGWWESLAFWRSCAIASAAVALVLSVVAGIAPRPDPPMAMLAVMHDAQGQPALVVSWPPMKDMREPHVRIKVVQEHPVMHPGTSWEMWLLPGAQAAPVSMGRIGIDRDQVMPIPPALARTMDSAWGIAMSVEPEGGSPTGAPSGPVVFRGRCVKLL